MIGRNDCLLAHAKVLQSIAMKRDLTVGLQSTIYPVDHSVVNRSDTSLLQSKIIRNCFLFVKNSVGANPWVKSLLRKPNHFPPIYSGNMSIPNFDIALFFSTGMAIQRSELHSWSNSYINLQPTNQAMPALWLKPVRSLPATSNPTTSPTFSLNYHQKVALGAPII